MDEMETAAPSVGRPRTFDRDHVVAVAVESYWTDGVGEVSLNEICRRAGVSKPGLYREFGGEDGLLDAALARYAETVLHTNFGNVSDDLPLVDLLTQMTDWIVNVERSGAAGCLLANMRQMPDRLGPLTRNRVAELREYARSLYAACIERAKDVGEVPSIIPTDVAVALIDFQLTNLLVQIALGEDAHMLKAQAMLSFAGLTGSMGNSSDSAEVPRADESSVRMIAGEPW